MLRLTLLVGVVMVVLMMVRPKALGIVDVASEWRAVRIARLVVSLIGAGVAVVVATDLDLGRGPMVAPAVLGAGVVAGVALSEVVVRPSRRETRRRRQAQSRRVRDFLPPGPTWVVAIVAIGLLATLVMTMITASPDDLGRAGRALTHQCGPNVEMVTPYPGSYYGRLLAEALAVIAALTVAALFTVVRHPEGFSPDHADVDAMRRRSADMVVSAAGAALCATHAGVAYFAGQALTRIECAAGWMAPVGITLFVTAAMAVVVFAWCVRRLFVDPLVRHEDVASGHR